MADTRSTKPSEKKLVQDIMSRNVRVVTPDTNLAEAFHVMASRPYRQLPVVEQKEGEDKPRLVGIITDRQVRLAADSPFGGENIEKIAEHLAQHAVKEVMRTGVITVEDTAPIVEAAKQIRVSNVGGLPVLNKDGELVGIITRTDLLDHLVRLLEPLPLEGMEE